jgi:hypothetical protein
VATTMKAARDSGNACCGSSTCSSDTGQRYGIVYYTPPESDTGRVMVYSLTILHLQ